MKCVPTSRSRRPRPAGPKQQKPSAAFRNVTGSKPVSERTSQGARLPGRGCRVRTRLCSLEPPLRAPQACSTPGRTAASAPPPPELAVPQGGGVAARLSRPASCSLAVRLRHHGRRSVGGQRACSWPCTVFTRSLLVQISPSLREWLSQHQLSGQNLTQNIL